MRQLGIAATIALLGLACAPERSEVANPWGGLASVGLDGSDDDGDEGDDGDGDGDADGTGDGGMDDGRPDDDGRPPPTDDGDTGDDGEPPPGDGGDDGPDPVECPANCYCEPFDATANVADLEGAFNGANWADTMIEVLLRRYPAGGDLLVEMQDDPWFGAFTDTSSFGGLMDSVMTEVHEGTHGWDWNHALGQPYFGYWLRSDLIFEPPKIDGFPRSEILGMVEGDSTSLYDGTYLTGTQGTYGWYELHDELNSYINGMGGVAAVGEHIPWGMSGRDGAVAFLYYLELYLRRARTNYPDLYAQLQASEYVELTQTQWLRTHFLLDFADAHPHIGIHDQEIRALLYAPQNQAEIEMFIGRAVDASNCLP